MSNNGSSNQYPDSEPATLGALKSIKRISGMKVVAPTIKWGNDYKKWPIEKRLRYAERLAATMNHAADILQIDRNKLNVLIKEKEASLVQAIKSAQLADSMLQKQLTRDNAAKQVLNKRIVELTQLNKKLRAELKAKE